MLRKFVSSFLAVLLLLSGCSSGKQTDTAEKEKTEESATASSSSQEEKKSQAAEDAAEIVDTLGLKDSMTAVRDRVISGMFFSGDHSCFTDGAAYLSQETGNSNTVAVFETKDAEKTTEALKTYIKNQAEDTASYFPEQVTKIQNAVVESNKKKVVFIVYDDADAAKKAADEILKK